MEKVAKRKLEMSLTLLGAQASGDDRKRQEKRLICCRQY